MALLDLHSYRKRERCRAYWKNRPYAVREPVCSARPISVEGDLNGGNTTSGNGYQNPHDRQVTICVARICAQGSATDFATVNATAPARGAG
jgi:hypothetical protein